MASDGSTTFVELVDGTKCIAAWPLAHSRPDLSIVNTLARLQLAARSLGWSIRVRNADEQLSALVAFVGLADLLPLEPGR